MNKAEKPPLKAGILAAGRGQRLQRHSDIPKPLIKVGGQTLIERVLAMFSAAGASEVTVIINEDFVAVRDHVDAIRWPFSLHWIIESTPTSMHSFLRLVETLAGDGDDGPFLLSTVDTVAGAQTYSRFMNQSRRFKEADVVLALTSFSDDEKPLLVKMTPHDSRIAAIGEAARPTQFATAGAYVVRASILREAEAARRDGLDALRTFLGRLLERGHYLVGVPIEESIDVDRPADIQAAEAFLQRGRV